MHTTDSTRRRRLGYLTFAAVLVVTGGACSSDDDPAADNDSGPTTTLPLLERTCAGKSRHVVVVGIDGLRADSLSPADAPRLDALISDGTATLNGYAGGELGTATEQPTVSGPGWATIVTGVWANRHHVLDNEFTTWAPAEPHFFTRITEADPDARLASIQQWIPVRVLVAGSAQRDEIGLAPEVEQFAVDEITTQDPTVVFLHFDDVDHAGHATGYGPDKPDYLAAIAATDTHIGAVLNAVNRRPTRDDECWATIVVTDHGGTGTGHGGQTPEERTIPIIVSGDGIAPQAVPEGPGHNVIPPTVFAYLNLPIDPTWGWPTPFAIPG